MEKEKIIEWITKPQMLDASSTEQLMNLLKEVPYFQTAHYLLLKSLKNNNEADFINQLPKSSLYITDRKKLYYFLYPEFYKRIRRFSDFPKNIDLEQIPEEYSEPIDKGHIEEKPIVKKVVDNKELLQMDYEAKESRIIDTTNVEIPSVFANETIVIELDEPEKVDSMAENLIPGPLITQQLPEEAPDIISNFIKANPRIAPRKDAIPVEDFSKSSIEETDDIFSETLAKIYIKQGLYSKAISIYEKLSLKFPEKNTYFASQITEIKKLIDK